MMDYEYLKLRAWLAVLKDVAKEYSGRTIDNVIQNVEDRVKYEEKRRSDVQV